MANFIGYRVDYSNYAEYRTYSKASSAFTHSAEDNCGISKLNTFRQQKIGFTVALTEINVIFPSSTGDQPL